jgi:hypothetical protein
LHVVWPIWRTRRGGAGAGQSHCDSFVSRGKGGARVVFRLRRRAVAITMHQPLYAGCAARGLSRLWPQRAGDHALARHGRRGSCLGAASLAQQSLTRAGSRSLSHRRRECRVREFRSAIVPTRAEDACSASLRPVTPTLSTAAAHSAGLGSTCVALTLPAATQTRPSQSCPSWPRGP